MPIRPPLTAHQLSRVRDLVSSETEEGFISVATALKTIRDLRLWEMESDSFDDFCKTNFGWTGEFCEQQIRDMEQIVALKQ